jgi:heat shock protein HtpX
VVAVVIAGVISFFGELVFRVFFQSGMTWGGGRSSSSSSSDKKGGAGAAILIALALVALCWILSIVVRFALSRKREYLADAGSVELTKNPDAMISALRKIEGRGELPGSNSAVMEMCIDNPREGFSNLFDTHPSVEKRVAALVQFAGGHDPGPLALPLPADVTPPDDGAPSEDTPVGGPWATDPNRPSQPEDGQRQIPGPPGGPFGGPWGPTRPN